MIATLYSFGRYVVPMLLALSFSACLKHSAPKTSVTEQVSAFLVLAHPDDETMIGGLLLELKRQNIPVYAVYLTSGEGGRRQTLNANGQWEAQEIKNSELKKIREFELAQIAHNFGIQKYFFLDQKDIPLRDKSGLPIRDGSVFLNKKLWNQKKVKAKLLSFVNQYRPTFIFGMSLEKNTHAHHKASRLILDELDLFNNYSFVKGVFAFKETGLVKTSSKDEERFPKLYLDRSKQLPGSDYTYAELNTEISKAHYSQRSGHTNQLAHREEVFQVSGSLELFYQLLCNKKNCSKRIEFIKKD